MEGKDDQKREYSLLILGPRERDSYEEESVTT